MKWRRGIQQKKHLTLYDALTVPDTELRDLRSWSLGNLHDTYVKQASIGMAPIFYGMRLCLRNQRHHSSILSGRSRQILRRELVNHSFASTSETEFSNVLHPSEAPTQSHPTGKANGLTPSWMKPKFPTTCMGHSMSWPPPISRCIRHISPFHGCQQYWSHFCFSAMPTSFQPQGLSPCCSPCLAQPFWNYPWRAPPPPVGLSSNVTSPEMVSLRN